MFWTLNFSECRKIHVMFNMKVKQFYKFEQHKIRIKSLLNISYWNSIGYGLELDSDLTLQYVLDWSIYLNVKGVFSHNASFKRVSCGFGQIEGIGITNIHGEINCRTAVMQEQWGAGRGPVVSKSGATEQIAANAQISAQSRQIFIYIYQMWMSNSNLTLLRLVKHIWM